MIRSGLRTTLALLIVLGAPAPCLAEDWTCREAPRLDGTLHDATWYRGALHVAWRDEDLRTHLSRLDAEKGWVTLGDFDFSVHLGTDGGAPEQARAGRAGQTPSSPPDDPSSREAGERLRRTHHTDGKELWAAGWGGEEGELLVCGQVALDPFAFARPEVIPTPKSAAWVARLGLLCRAAERWFWLDVGGKLHATRVRDDAVSSTELGPGGGHQGAMTRFAVAIGEVVALVRLTDAAADPGKAAGTLHVWHEDRWTERALPGEDGGDPALGRRVVGLAASGAELLCAYVRGDPGNDDGRASPAEYFVMTSTDLGVTWSPPRLTLRLTSRLLQPARIGLAATEGLTVVFAQEVSAWQRLSTGAEIPEDTTLQVATSVDGGVTWENEAIQAWGGEPHVTAVVEADGSIYFLAASDDVTRVAVVERQGPGRAPR